MALYKMIKLVPGSCFPVFFLFLCFQFLFFIFSKSTELIFCSKTIIKLLTHCF